MYKESKQVAPLFLGILSFIVFMVVGESSTYHLGNVLGALVTFSFLGAYFFICQFALSRGHPRAYRSDWRIMLLLDAIPLLAVIVMVFSEKLEVIMTQGLGILLSCCGGTLAGAVVAAWAARRKDVRKNSSPTSLK